MATSAILENPIKGAYNELEVHDEFPGDVGPLYSQASRFTVRDELHSRPYRTATFILGTLSAVLLVIIIGLSVHINRVSDKHDILFLNSSRMIFDFAQLKLDHKQLSESKLAVEKKHTEDTKLITSLQLNLNKVTSLKNDLDSQNQNLQEEKRKLQSQLDHLEDNCGQCLPSWVLMNNTCYLFAVSETSPRRGWDGSRQDCKNKGAELLVIDSKEEQEFIWDTLKALRYNLYFSYNNGFYIGLKDDETEGIWKWLNGTSLTQGYWMDGEPNNDQDIEHCAAIYPSHDFMKSWNDVPCSHPLKWICEMKMISSPNPANASAV